MTRNPHAPLSKTARGAAFRASPKAVGEPLEEANSPPRKLVWLVPSICLGALIWVGIFVWILG
jgi:hypothetical protein